METKRSRRAMAAMDTVGWTESPRRQARRSPDGTLKDFAPTDLSEDMRSMVSQLAARVDELTGALDLARRRVAELETMTDEDVQLPVLNRGGFMRELKRAISVVDRYAMPAALICLDVDGLKAINDAYGHAAGDAVLREVVARVRLRLRASDIVGRLGGREFGAILWSASAGDVAQKAETLAAAIAGAPISVAGHQMRVAVSAGATALAAADSAETALARADAAMDRATRGGA
ncbi:GGDEF domain-containing protein [Microbaculum marinisediminis]|uniref:diguanylate cyclase n=1 Tax=Microbaculum marinisediminis TaxID=2931392 RepID=A0AAW5QZ72_9HYPH|nr:GGDEF domain-containing protein [Microbaculum sp. A6E488]MCT8971701.1 GGDEF domain-containing protein [Microbaculum sp. A6E488]